jgi:hypothetical protein
MLVLALTVSGCAAAPPSGYSDPDYPLGYYAPGPSIGIGVGGGNFGRGSGVGLGIGF